MDFKTELTSDTSDLTDKEKDVILFATNQEWGMPSFKMEHFVGNSQFTIYGKLKQYFVELRNREEMIEDIEIGVAKCEASIELEEELKSKTDSRAQKKLHDIEIKKYIQDRNRYLRRLHVGYEERKKYIDLIQKIKDNKEDILPDGRSIIDVFGNDEEEENLEKHYWTERLGKQAGLDLIAYGRIGAGNMEAITQLGIDHQYETMQYAVSFSTQKQLEIASMQQKTLEIMKNNDSAKAEIEGQSVFNFRD
jgi:hypothetical protein